MNRNTLALGLSIAAIVLSVTSMITMSYVEREASAAAGKQTAHMTVMLPDAPISDVPIPEGARVEVAPDPDTVVAYVEKMAGVPINAPLEQAIRAYVASPTGYWQSDRALSDVRVELEPRCGDCVADAAGGFSGKLVFLVDTRVSVNGSWTHTVSAVVAGSISSLP